MHGAPKSRSLNTIGAVGMRQRTIRRHVQLKIQDCQITHSYLKHFSSKENSNQQICMSFFEDIKCFAGHSLSSIVFGFNQIWTSASSTYATSRKCETPFCCESRVLYQIVNVFLSCSVHGPRQGKSFPQNDSLGTLVLLPDQCCAPVCCGIPSWQARMLLLRRPCSSHSMFCQAIALLWKRW